MHAVARAAVIIIGLIPFLNPAKADDIRLAGFPWAYGTYPGFGGAPVDNLQPTHHRFITENAAYAIMRGGAALYSLMSPSIAMPALVMAVRPTPTSPGPLHGPPEHGERHHKNATVRAHVNTQHRTRAPRRWSPISSRR